MCKKRMTGIIGAALCVSLLLAGCSVSLPDFFKIELPKLTAETQEEPSALQENTVIVLERDEADADAVQTLPQDDLAAVQETLVSQETGNYAYEQLDENAKLIYSEILSILKEHGKEVQVSTVDTELIDKAFKCVMLDHPEIFYITGYSITKYTRGNAVEKITLSGTYTMDAEQEKQKQLAIDTYADACLAGMPEGADEYEKVKYIYEYLIQNTEYDLNAPENQNILSVFLEGKSVCQGYAKATQYLLYKAGVFCTLVEGSVKGREAHVWNLVRVNGSYYYVDTTWGDASYNLTSDGGTPSVQVPEINYDYLCVPETMLAGTHVISETVPLPQCISMQDNYYVREGIYFERVDEMQLNEAFANAYSQKQASVTLKCSNESIYTALYQYLIWEEKIFDYLQNDESVSYVEMNDQLSLLFYL